MITFDEEEEGAISGTRNLEAEAAKQKKENEERILEDEELHSKVVREVGRANLRVIKSVQEEFDAICEKHNFGEDTSLKIELEEEVKSRVLGFERRTTIKVNVNKERPYGRRKKDGTASAAKSRKSGAEKL